MIYVSLKIDWKRNVCPMILINVCPSRFDRTLNECPIMLINVCPLDGWLDGWLAGWQRREKREGREMRERGERLYLLPAPLSAHTV